MLHKYNRRHELMQAYWAIYRVEERRKRRLRFFKARSFTYNFIFILSKAIFGTLSETTGSGSAGNLNNGILDGEQPITALNGSSRNYVRTSNVLGLYYGGTVDFTGPGRDDYGIIIGEGTQTCKPMCYNLGAKIPHDTNFISYGKTEKSPIEILSSPQVMQFKFARNFTNNSTTESKTVSEVAFSISNVNTPFVIIYDTLGSPVTMQPLQVYRVELIIRVPY